MKNGKMGTHGCQQRMERCSVLTAKSLIHYKQKQIHLRLLGSLQRTLTVNLPLNYGGMMLKTTRRLVDAYGQSQRPKQVVITFYQFITNVVQPQLGFKK